MKRSKQRILGGLAAMVASLAVAAPAAADPTVATLPVGTAAANGHTVQVTAAGGIESVAQSEVARSLPVGTAVAGGDAVRVDPTGAIETVATDDAVRSLPVGTAVGDGGAVRISPEGAIEPMSRSVPATIVVAPGGLDWTDAGIGAGMALGLILLGGGLLLATRRHREPTAPVAH